jgi:hypothetical protein
LVTAQSSEQGFHLQVIWGQSRDVIAVQEFLTVQLPAFAQRHNQFRLHWLNPGVRVKSL